MLDGNIFVLHALCLRLGFGEYLVEVGRDVYFADFSAAAGYARHSLYEFKGGSLYAVCVNVHSGEYLRDKSALVGEQRVKQVLLLNAVVLIADGQILRRLHGFY